MNFIKYNIKIIAPEDEKRKVKEGLYVLHKNPAVMLARSVNMLPNPV